MTAVQSKEADGAVLVTGAHEEALSRVDVSRIESFDRLSETRKRTLKRLLTTEPRAEGVSW